MVSPNANLELRLENTTPTFFEKGFCRAKTEIGHKICKEIGNTIEGKNQNWYYF